MENQSSTPTPNFGEWTAAKVYALGATFLVLGIALGALFHGPTQSQSADLATQTNVASRQQTSQMPMQMPPYAGGTPQSMARRSPDPVFDSVKSDPNNFTLLVQAGIASMKSGTPMLAVDYYSRALKVKEDLDVRTNLGVAYFRAGNADQALVELSKVLKADPKNDKALYNQGVVRLMAKNDAKGALESWESFLKYNPDHPQKARVQQMIERLKSSGLNFKG